MVQRAQTEQRRAALAEEFGLGLLTKKFGEAGAALVLEAFGVYRSGKRKGQPRGFIYWTKVSVGGWKRTDRYDRGRVMRPGSYEFAVGLTFERTGSAMSARTECAQMSDAEWLVTLSRGLGGITKRWNYEKDAPTSEFPKAWATIRADFDAEKSARLAVIRAEYFSDAR